MPEPWHFDPPGTLAERLARQHSQQQSDIAALLHIVKCLVMKYGGVDADGNRYVLIDASTLQLARPAFELVQREMQDPWGVEFKVVRDASSR